MGGGNGRGIDIGGVPFTMSRKEAGFGYFLKGGLGDE